MINKLFQAMVAAYAILFPAISVKGQQALPSYPVTPVPFTSVHISDDFWAPRIRMNHEVTIPIAIQKCRETGRIDNFLFAAGIKKGAFCTEYPFDDSDLYKILEGASYSIQMFPDPELEKTMDTLIGIIGKAQEPDGYLYTNRTIDPQHLHPWVGKERWEKDPELSHELYNLGHLYEAAVAHYQATGKRTLLDIAIKSANLVYSDFIGKKLPYYPGHQVIEMGLVKLYRVTQDKRYLDLAKYFLDIRKGGEEYNQAQKPVVEQDKIVGHAVRATYMYSGMADIAAIEGVTAYTEALDKIWDDLIGTKYYITGGIGSSGSNEGFSDAYDLPNLSAYCETCASIGLVYWNYRMFLSTGNSKYYDVLERTLYNGLLSGVSLSGDHFFYPNVLESRGQHERSPWFGCACCPSNICRFMPSIPGYVYAVKDNELFANLYVKNHSEMTVSGKMIRLQMETAYPWSGHIGLTVNPEEMTGFILKLRIPSWASGTPVPSDLYSFAGHPDTRISISVNGKPAGYTLQNGYACLDRKWEKGDKVVLELPMEVLEVQANPAVAADRDRIALQRGPLMYCLEWPDQPGEKVLNRYLTAGPVNTAFEPSLLNGVEVLKGTACTTKRTNSGIEKDNEVPFMAIPYYAWANRGAGEMSVWIATRPEITRPAPLPTIANSSKLVASTSSKTLACLNDGELPENSNDHNLNYYHWWPKKDTTEWIEYDFPEAKTISEASVYWFDDGPWGGCRIPASWRIVFKKGDNWVPVENKSDYPVLKDTLNTVSFQPFTTTAVRLEVVLQKEYSSGLYEWSIK